jgi:crotonobetainyl-CoA:carnitine CoA-transferase CaiB-like acyl-CoA transferase
MMPDPDAPDLASNKQSGIMQMKPLTSCRVLDLGIITAGAATSAILADMGADVIKIESPAYRDPFRNWDGAQLDDTHPDLPPYFRMTNRGKRNLGIDLKSAEGREVFLRLVQSSDVIVENFSRGVLDRLGLGYDALRAANPDIILASISSQGEFGPDTAYVSFGSTLEAMSGLAATTGYLGGPPVVSGKDLNYPDQVVAIFAAGMVVTAWLAKERGQGGAHLDLSQRDLTSFLCGDAFSSPTLRRGNGDPAFALQDCFLSADNHWIAITFSEDDLQGLAALGITTSHDGIAEWIGARIVRDALAILEELGIAAAKVLDGTEVFARRGTDWARAIASDALGKPLKGTLFETGERPASLDRPARLVGADSLQVLLEVGGFERRQVLAMESVFCSGDTN